MKVLPALTAALLLCAGSTAGPFQRFRILENEGSQSPRALQDIITWDDKSLFIRGERIMIFSGEFHPFRLPVPSLWLDVFQKIKALGMNTASFYIDWALLEGKRGSFSAEGPLALEPFFEAAKQAGIYLIARPGPYINAEAAGGGFPGWMQRLNATFRTKEPAYLEATSNYVSNVARAIANAQITNGGPVILYQPENEYTSGTNGFQVPDGQYMQDVIDQARDAGIVVPMINNDQSPNGDDAPGSGLGAVDIYGHDAYFFGTTDCETPSIWPAAKLPTNYYQLHLQESPDTPYSLLEFQAGCWLPWGGTTFDNCAALMDASYERVYYKNDLSFGVAIMNLYMTAGGSNWGNLGFPQGYSSYDYGSAITEERTVERNKYSELKLIANFLKTSPSYLDAIPQNLTQGVYTQTTDLTVTPLLGNETASSFYVVRHTDETNTASTTYTLSVSTSKGNVTIPQLGGTLTLNGRDSKVHVVDYPVPEGNVVYSSAEVLTWKKFDDQTVLVVYGGPGELHEMEVQVSGARAAKVSEGGSSKIRTKNRGTSIIINWTVTLARQIVQLGNLKILMLDRNDAYNYWVPELSPSGQSPGFSTWAHTENSVIVKAGYLVRNAYVRDNQLYIDGDFNSTTPLEVIGAPKTARSLVVNGQHVSHSIDPQGFWTTTIRYFPPDLNLPDLQSLKWKYADSLPEIITGYNDAAWPKADLGSTYNTYVNLSTPTSLLGSDYGFNTGYLIFRGSFAANGKESQFTLQTQGGSSYGSSVWLNDKYLGSWTGDPALNSQNLTLSLPALKPSKTFTFTVIVDQNGFEENGAVGDDIMKTPRGILAYQLSGHNPSDIAWKITGNLGGEDYMDRVRGPLNEGGLFAERQGWHQPNPPSKQWSVRSPLTGIQSAGVGFFSASFHLNILTGYDVPLYVTFANTTSPSQPYRVQLYVNGYQFGKYTNNIGPQTSFIVPQGILNYYGENWIAITLWAQQSNGAKLDGLALTSGTPIMTAYRSVELVDTPPYTKRRNAY